MNKYNDQSAAMMRILNKILKLKNGECKQILTVKKIEQKTSNSFLKTYICFVLIKK